MLVVSQQARILWRLIPRINGSAHIQNFRIASVLSVSPNRSSCSTCPLSLLTRELSIVKFSSVPRRHLAGASKENYILDQNTLTETEKNEIETSVKKDFEDWVPYGFHPTDKEEDIFRYKMFMFTCLTWGVIIFSYFFYHAPPRNNREWVTREAYLELERRRRLGLPLVDKDLIPAEKVLLPSLEELGDDYDIII